MNINDEKKLKELQALMTGMVESVLSASDEDILNEAREDGRDLNKDLFHTKSTLLASVQESKLHRLREARKRHERSVAAISATKASIPETAEERRNLLTAIFSRNASLKAGVLTAQHRDLKEMTDSDIESLLKELAALGLLDTSGH